VRRFTKVYPTPEGAAAAAEHHAWLAEYRPLLRVPDVLDVNGVQLQLEHVDGRHPAPGDLPDLADHLGTLHAGLHRQELHAAQLNVPFTTATGLVISDFLSSRRAAIADRLARSLVPEPALTPAAADQLLTSTAEQPAAIYKDTNIRNILITGAGPVHVDFDDLTLAPVGYDLAKLLLSAAMTHGAPAIQRFPEAIRGYNHALSSGGLPPCRPEQLTGWLGIHHILTAAYLHRNGYKYSWNQFRYLFRSA